MSKWIIEIDDSKPAFANCTISKGGEPVHYVQAVRVEIDINDRQYSLQTGQKRIDTIKLESDITK